MTASRGRGSYARKDNEVVTSAKCWMQSGTLRGSRPSSRHQEQENRLGMRNRGHASRARRHRSRARLFVDVQHQRWIGMTSHEWYVTRAVAYPAAMPTRAINRRSSSDKGV